MDGTFRCKEVWDTRGKRCGYGTHETQTVALRINNKVVRKVTTVLGENGEESYSLFAKDKVLKKKDKVEIIGYDSSGNTRTVLSVKVTN